MKPTVALKRFCLLFGFVLLFSLARTQTVKDSTASLFTVDTVARALGYPWEILHGPDDSLWITEARGYRVVRISVGRTGLQKSVQPQQVLKLPLGSAEVSFSRGIGTWPQGGMQGLVLHPEFKSGKPWAYLSYVYSGACPGSPSGPCTFRTKIVRCRFYKAGEAGNPSLRTPKADSLVIMDTVMSNLPGSNDHNSGRLAVGPVKEGAGNTYKLYYTIGDMGAGQFNNASRTNLALDLDTCEGKILRLNTEPDGDGLPSSPVHDYDKWRQWIPNDNPFALSLAPLLKTPVYSYGHRNAQGLAWGQAGGTWRLYSSEQGDKSDDEVNVIEGGANYGWPKVAGLADNNYSNSDADPDNDVLAGQTVTWSESAWAAANGMKRPLFSLFNAAPGNVPANGTNIFTWPTVAPSSLDFYNGNIPGWKNSLLVTSLKYGLFRLKLNAAGTFVDSAASTNAVDTFPLLHGWRVRDLAINPLPNSGEFWVVIDSTGSTSGPTGGFGGTSTSTKDGGAVLRLRYKTAITLPVNFVHFGARPRNHEVLLTWKLSGEKPASLQVEKSADGLRFFPLGNPSPLAESFVDKQPFTGNNFYRLRATENGGKSTYTQTVNVPYSPGTFAVHIYPNPVGDVLQLRLNAANSETVWLDVRDAAGRTVHRQQTAVRAGPQTLSVSAKGWSAQAYTLSVLTSNGRLLARQAFVKPHP